MNWWWYCWRDGSVARKASTAHCEMDIDRELTGSEFWFLLRVECFFWTRLFQTVSAFILLGGEKSKTWCFDLACPLACSSWEYWNEKILLESSWRRVLAWIDLRQTCVWPESSGNCSRSWIKHWINQPYFIGVYFEGPVDIDLNFLFISLNVSSVDSLIGGLALFLYEIVKFSEKWPSIKVDLNDLPSTSSALTTSFL